jgi:uncharacterized delta-60 repeat protein
MVGLVLSVAFVTGAIAAGGDLDPSFGDGGKVTTDFGSYEVANAVTIQSNGKIVAVGQGYAGMALARYNSDGSLDASFGLGGRVSTTCSCSANAIAIAPGGQIVVAGQGYGGTVDFLVARYNRDGSLDTSFGSEGIVTTSFGDYDIAGGVVVQPSGKIVAAGGSLTGLGADYDFALARYNDDGSLDTSFGSGGKVTTAIGFGEDLALQPGGKLVVAGLGYTSINASSDFAVARYNTDGSLDTSFGSDGAVTTDISGSGSDDLGAAVAILPGARIAVAGRSGGDFALALYNADGSLDMGFGSGGTVTTDFGGYEIAAGVVVQPSGKLVAGGVACCGVATFSDFALARYNKDGSLDTSFGQGGKTTTDFGDFDEAHSVAIEPGGKIVAAGYTQKPAFGNDFALARYLP